MRKPRNAQAVAAWERRGGAHGLAGKPDLDERVDIDGQLEADGEGVYFAGTITIDGEEYEIEFDWNEEEEEEGDPDE